LLGTRYLYFVVPILFILIGYFLDFVVDCLGYSFSGIRDFLMRKKVCQADAEKNAYVNIIRKLRVFFNSRSYCRVTANIVVFLLFISAIYFSPAFTFTPKERYDLGANAPQSNFRDAYMYVKGNMQPDDVIVSAWTPPSQFYLGKSDYWLAFNVVGTGIDAFVVGNTSREIYTNATVIQNVGMLENVTEKHERGWIVVDNLAWHKLPREIRDYIEIETEQRLYDTTMRVYMWNGTD
jgi:hypothetical protein